MTNTNTTNKKDNKKEFNCEGSIEREVRVNGLISKYLELKNQFIKGIMKTINGLIRKGGNEKSEQFYNIRMVLTEYLVSMNRDGFKETLNKNFYHVSIISYIRLTTHFTNYGTNTMVFTTEIDTVENQYPENCVKLINTIVMPKELYSIMLKMERLQEEIGL